jgi:TPR repeat protein
VIDLRVLILRKSASGNHPGAMLWLGKACLNSELALPNTGLVKAEGVNWLKRAADAATPLYSNAPYDLALLHEFGYEDIVFPDEQYAVQLFQQASDLGHSEASYRLGELYEYGHLGCPEDAALSIHYFSLSAQNGNPYAMLSLCAWYMVGAEGVLEKSEEEAFAWAQRAAEAGLAKGEFTAGYFLERGVGCQRDGLEAWGYYVRAAEQGDERAISRLKAGKDWNPDQTCPPIESSLVTESEMGNLAVSEVNTKGVQPTFKLPKAGGNGVVKARTKDKDCILM